MKQIKKKKQTNKKKTNNNNNKKTHPIEGNPEKNKRQEPA